MKSPRTKLFFLLPLDAGVLRLPSCRRFRSVGHNRGRCGPLAAAPPAAALRSWLGNTVRRSSVFGCLPSPPCSSDLKQTFVPRVVGCYRHSRGRSRVRSKESLEWSCSGRRCLDTELVRVYSCLQRLIALYVPYRSNASFKNAPSPQGRFLKLDPYLNIQDRKKQHIFEKVWTRSSQRLPLQRWHSVCCGGIELSKQVQGGAF